MRWVTTISGATGFYGGPVHRIAARSVAAVGPVENAVLVVEFEIDRLR
jgi:hypothetical protein